MPPKRTHADANSEATAYFVALMCQWEPKDARDGSYHELILDAHEWGEARVRAEVSAMQLRNLPARKRYNALCTTAEKWYEVGYRMYLLPNSRDSLDALRHRKRTNEALMHQTEQARRDLARQAAITWRKTAAKSAIFTTALSAAEAESVATAAAAATPSSPARATVSPATAPLRTRELMARVPPTPPEPALPPTLVRFLEAPTEPLASAPHPSIDAAVAEAFRTQRVLRAWGDELTYLERPAYALHDDLRARGMDHVYGCAHEDLGKDAMRRAGFQRLAGGAYNTIWVAQKNTAPWLRTLFCPEVGDALCNGHLVLRTPRSKAGWLTFDQAVGEASNMLFTALRGIGPRVALLSYVRTTVDNAQAGGEEGLRAVRYRLFALLERACETVDKRYAIEATPASSATECKLYARALLVCVYQFSHEGYVHLDGTLRNFVDVYPHQLLNHRFVEWCVKVIDVDEKSFRRLCPEASPHWRDLFLINLLVVFTFLKQRLGARWNHERHWLIASRCVAKLMRTLPQRTTLPAIAFWEGPFNPYEEFPTRDPPEYTGRTHQASAKFLLRQMRYYLLRQPFEQCEGNYLEVVSKPTVTSRQLETARNWYDHTYQLDMYPAHRFFRDALQPRANGKPRLFALVLYEYLNTPFADLRTKYSEELSPSTQHWCFGAMLSRERVLGLV